LVILQSKSNIDEKIVTHCRVSDKMVVAKQSEKRTNSSDESLSFYYFREENINILGTRYKSDLLCDTLEEIVLAYLKFTGSFEGAE